ncbi:MAG: dTMP kinase [Planctomycetaceae bacterium]|jgi:dTMP kinase|nr:dTMP kinase [Planctomycetaceae bacterium]
MFITLDGGDGCGKTTQQKRLGDWLRSIGREVILCREPGGTQLGDKIRKIVLGNNNENEKNNISNENNKNNCGDELCICDVSEMFLFMASRAQLVNEVIKPAILAGKDVISDRFLISSIVYQGYAGGVPIEAIEFTGNIATLGITPDVGIILDIPYEESIKRIGNRVKDRMERKGEEYHKKVRNGFLEYAKKNPSYAIINATATPDEIEKIIRKKIITVHGNLSDRF